MSTTNSVELFISNLDANLSKPEAADLIAMSGGLGTAVLGGVEGIGVFYSELAGFSEEATGATEASAYLKKICEAFSDQFLNPAAVTANGTASYAITTDVYNAKADQGAVTLVSDVGAGLATAGLVSLVQASEFGLYAVSSGT